MDVLTKALKDYGIQHQEYKAGDVSIISSWFSL